MKTSLLLSFKRASALAAFGLLTGLPFSAHAATQTYGGMNVWDVTNTNWGGLWDNSGTGVALFNGVGENVVIGSDLNIGGMTFSTTGYVLDNNAAYTIALNGSSTGSALILNAGNITLNGASSTNSGISIENGVFLDATGLTAAGSLGNVSTVLTGFPTQGQVSLGSQNLTVGNLTLSSGDPLTVGNSTLSFSLATPSTTGSIIIGTGSSFNAPSGAFLGSVSIAVSGTNILAGTYTLVDWTAGSVAGLSSPTDVSDFVLGPINGSYNSNVSSAVLEIQGNKLVLVAVPEPATVAMPLAACLGLLVLRRRASRMPLVA